MGSSILNKKVLLQALMSIAPFFYWKKMYIFKIITLKMYITTYAAGAAGALFEI